MFSFEPTHKTRKGCGVRAKGKMLRFILKAANSIINVVVVCCLSIAGIYAVYALWDNNRVYTAAENVQADMVKLRPVIEEDSDDGGASFEELLAINQDVCAWVILDNTNIDYPVLQGETNLTYINRNVYGEFALAGSIYLDTRNKKDFSDAYSLLYGHHMENSGMFGDLDLYKEEAFFEENKTGLLMLPDKAYELEIFACLLVDAGEDIIFEPEQWRIDIDGLVTFVQNDHVYVREETIQKIEQTENIQILAFSTCSSEFTDARTIILAVMEPYQTAD